ncbi:COX15/CtaA family protein [Vibrio panuliri]|uniref:Cytochrome B n=1 Tax=Vibrio panuliri TaxID=1381081 RepID=A0ABX3FAN9_9VIBR|nr:COX15/CtaA family protein [Vibrio panuliri]KAB1457704.1 heme A synthase [Vibrio panuliri]OLQ85812.1 cytochrome B [Vibrio panuliri]
MMLKRLLQLTLVMTFCVILLGAYTRLADAGLGCPDWPGCYGQLDVPSSQAELAKANLLYPDLVVEADKAWLEMIHRYFAGSLGLLVFAITALALKQKQFGKLLPLSVSFVVIFQALLGMWTVTMKLMPVVVMGHLLGGFTLFSLLALLYWRVSHSNQNSLLNRASVGLRTLALIAFAALTLQIALGGWTSSNYAALMCTELPICQGNWQGYLDFETAFRLIQPERDSYEFGTLDYGARMTIHVSHRVGAIITSGIFLILIVQLWRQNQGRYRRQSISLTLLLVTQIGLGISNVSFGLPLAVAVAHNLVAALLLINTLYVNHLLWLSAAESRSHALRTMGKEAYYE